MTRAMAVGMVCVLVAGAACAADAVMGDWQGSWKAADGKEQPLVAQVIGLGDGNYRANLLAEFDKRIPPIVVLNGKGDGATAKLSGRAGQGDLKGADWIGKVEGEAFTGGFGSFKGAAAGTFALRKVVRKSPTLGAKPPQGAIILLDGKSLEQFVHRNDRPCRWKLTEDGAMEVVRGTGGIISKPKFTDHKLHVEFRTPYEPKARGQGRGNSGVYLQGRYEVQVLDSYGLEGKSNECGGIYGVGAPRVNMCYPPLAWQTYDITFRAPRFDADGKKTEEARMTVVHNGVLIHEDVDVPKPTTACWDRDITQPGGLHLQDHGNPVRYRNIWAVKIKE